MAYELRPLRRYKARYDSDNADNPMRVAVVVDGAPIAWTGAVGDSAKATVYASGSSTAIETDTALTCVVGESVIEFAVDTSADTDSYLVKTGYRADLTIEIGGVVYVGHVLFDVAKYLLRIPLTYDQLLDRDARLRGRDWGGDDDFSGLIEACRDEFQLRLEAMAHDTGLVLENMAIDANKLAVPFRLYVLGAIFRGSNEDWALNAAEDYEGKFETSWKTWCAQFKADTSQSGSESVLPIKRVYQRLRT
jgi:hypothetical protein